MRNNIIIIIALIFVSCSDNSTDSGAPYSGEGISKYLNWQVSDMVAFAKIDTTYRTETSLISDFKIIGNLYIGTVDQFIELSMQNGDENFDLKSVGFDPKYKVRFSTDNDSNTFEFQTEFRINENFGDDTIFGHYFHAYIEIDSIYIGSDTLYRSSLGADSLNYPFLIPEKRWYVEGQPMYDSVNSIEINDLLFLSDFFTDEIGGKILSNQLLYDGSIVINRD